MFDTVMAERIDDALTTSGLIARVHGDSVTDLRHAVLALVARTGVAGGEAHEQRQLATFVETRIQLWRTIGWPAAPDTRGQAA